MASRFLNLLARIIVAVEIEDVGDEVKRILIVWHFGIQAGEVEAVREIFLVYLTEILVSPGRNKLQVWLERGASKVW